VLLIEALNAGKEKELQSSIIRKKNCKSYAFIIAYKSLHLSIPGGMKILHENAIGMAYMQSCYDGLIMQCI
jgi:hypothetical protein